MAVYDDEDKSIYDKPDEYSPGSLKSAEEQSTESAPLDTKTKAVKSSKNPAIEAEGDEYDAINDRYQSLYKQDYPDGEARDTKLQSRKKLAKRLGIIGGVVGIPSLLFGMSVLPGLLAIFKLDTFLQNIDASTFSRFNASFEGRSDKWMKAYLKLRMTELDGKTHPGTDTLYFRAGGIDTKHPIRDWYFNLRNSKFEEKVFNKNGIFFTTAEITGANGAKKFVPARITIKDVPLDNLGSYNIGDDLNNLSTVTGALNKLGPDADKFIEKELFSDNKSARKSIKKLAKEETKAWQVFKRRSVRKMMQNQAGVKKWRLFERTRDKIDAKKIELQNKILKMVLPENRAGLFIGCLFGANKCPGNGDPAAPESNDPGKSTGQVPEGADPGEEFDSNGNPVLKPLDPDKPDGVKTSSLIPGDTPGEAAKEAAGLLDNTLEDNADDLAAKEGPIKRYTNKLLAKIIGEEVAQTGAAASNPVSAASKIWKWLKKIAKIHTILHGDGSGKNVIGKMVLQARRMQYIAAYASMAIALSQMKSGDIQGTEILSANKTATTKVGNIFADAAQNTLSLTTKNGQINQYMQFFDGAEKSEAWILYSGGRTGNTAKAFAAAENGDMGRSWYCDQGEAARKDAPVQYLCPDDGLNGGRGDAIKKAYDSTIGIVIAPIASVVNAIKGNIIVKAFSFVSDIADKVIGAIVGPILEKLISWTGLGKLIGDVVSGVMGKLLEFAGAGIKYFPGKAGQLNFMSLGAASSAENSTRDSGGIASTKESLQYSNKLAADWKKENEKNLSTFDKFFALSNTKSITSRALMAVVTSSPKTILRDAANPGKNISNFASIISGAVYADNNPDIEASTVADWGGVPKYDVPQVCMDLDPLDKDYLNKATNAPAGVPRDMATLTNSAKFWAAVYANTDGPDEGKEEKTANIYNCALLDSRVMTGLGYVHSGYSNDDSEKTASDGLMSSAVTKTYETGTASQSGSEVTGTGTAWTADMIGGTITFSDGKTATITNVISPTKLTVSVSQTVDPATTYKITQVVITTEGGPGNTQPVSTTPVSVQELNCDGFWVVGKSTSGNGYNLRDNGMPTSASIRTYARENGATNTSIIKSVCEKTKSECATGALPVLSQKILCESYKYSKVFYGAPYTTFNRPVIGNDGKQEVDASGKVVTENKDWGKITRDYYGVKVVKAPDWNGPSAWKKDLLPGLANGPNNGHFAGCTGLATIALYDAFGVTNHAQATSGSNRKFKQIKSISEIKPGDIIVNKQIGHTVIAASEVVDNKLVVFNATGFGRAAGFGVVDFSKKNGWQFTDANVGKQLKIGHYVGSENAN